MPRYQLLPIAFAAFAAAPLDAGASTHGGYKEVHRGYTLSRSISIGNMRDGGREWALLKAAERRAAAEFAKHRRTFQQMFDHFRAGRHGYRRYRGAITRAKKPKGGTVRICRLRFPMRDYCIALHLGRKLQPLAREKLASDFAAALCLAKGKPFGGKTCPAYDGTYLLRYGDAPALAAVDRAAAARPARPAGAARGRDRAHEKVVNRAVVGNILAAFYRGRPYPKRLYALLASRPRNYHFEELVKWMVLLLPDRHRAQIASRILPFYKRHRARLAISGARGSRLVAQIEDQLLRLPSPRALFAAIHAGRLAAVKRLLAAGVDPRARDRGTPALTLAVLADRPRIAAALLAKGARVDDRDRIKATALGRACNRRKLALVKVILRHADLRRRHKRVGQEALREAVGQRATAIFKLLLRRGADPNFKDKHGRPLLFETLSPYRRPLFELLLKRRKTDLKLRDKRGRTALIAAAGRGNAPAVRALLRRRAPVNASDKRGRNALMAAAYRGCVDCVAALLARRARVAARDRRGRSALDLARRALRFRRPGSQRARELQRVIRRLRRAGAR